MRAPIVTFLAAFSLAGCCGEPIVVWSPNSPPFNAFQAAMRLQVGMPTDVAISLIGSAPVSGEAKSCGVAGGYEWPCQLLKFGCCGNNQLLVYIAPTPDGRGAVNSWSVGKTGATWG
jgi:hypothetical protein